MPFPDNLVSSSGVVGIGLWAIALYLGLASWQQWITQTLESWLLPPKENSAQGSTESLIKGLVHGLLVVLSTLPFLGLGAICAVFWSWSLGESWSISLSLLACLWLGIYELGRQNNTL